MQDMTEQRGWLALIAPSVEQPEGPAISRARSLAACWRGPVVLVTIRQPTEPVPPSLLPDSIALVAADESVEAALSLEGDDEARVHAVGSLLGAASSKGPIERLYVLADQQLVELLPAFDGVENAPPLDIELLPEAGLPEVTALWPYADSLTIADEARLYPLATGRPSLPVRIVPSGHGEDAVRALASLPSLGGTPRLSVVMPVRGGEARVIRATEAVLARTPELFELILVDDASPDRTREHLARAAHHDPRVRLLTHEQQQGFAATCNEGLAAVRGDAVALLGADTVVTPKWSTRLLSHLAGHNRAGVVAPLSNRAPALQRFSPVGYDEATLSGLDEFSERFAGPKTGLATPVSRLSGICLVLLRRTLRLVGGFDPRFFPGGFEDDDWCLRLLSCRLIPYRAEDVFIHHEGATSLVYESESASEIHERTWQVFKDKWGLPRGRSLGRGYDFKELIRGPYERSRHFIPPWRATEGVTS